MEELLKAYVVNTTHNDKSIGIKIVEKDTKGRVVEATKSFQVGEIALRERPLIVWTQEFDNPYSEYLNFFLSADSDIKKIILDMFAPSIDSPCVQRLKPCERYRQWKFNRVFLC